LPFRALSGRASGFLRIHHHPTEAKELNLKTLDDLYVAGLFDGEGYVTVRIWEKPNSKHVRCQIFCGIAMTYRPVIEMLCATYGGNIKQNRHDLRNRKHRIQFQWIAASRQANSVLKRLYPYLVVKKAEVEIALKLQDHIDAHKYKSGNQLHSHPERDRLLDERRSMANQIKALKKTRFPSLTTVAPCKFSGEPLTP
jgi:hypothetical protein